MTLLPLLATLGLLLVPAVGLVVAVAFHASPRDPLLCEEAPWGCSRCGRAWTRLADFYGHKCTRQAVR